MNKLAIITVGDIEYVRVNSLISVFETDTSRPIYDLFSFEEGSVTRFSGRTLEADNLIRQGRLYLKMEDAERDHLYGLGYSRR